MQSARKPLPSGKVEERESRLSWIDEVEGATPIERALGHRPELLRRYKAFYRSLWRTEALPRRVLELCRLRVAAIHGCGQEWQVRDAGVVLTDGEEAALEQGELSVFPADEQAALAVAARFPLQHHAISDAEMAAVKAVFAPKGAVALLIALAFFDVTCRWKLAFAVQGRSVQLPRPPLQNGALA